MFARKLAALEYHSANAFDYNDERKFRNFISWIENQKIRLYKVEDRTWMDNIDDQNWPNSFARYLQDLNVNNCSSGREVIIEQLLSQAIRFDYLDNLDKYEKKAQESEFLKSEASANEELLENIDYTSPDFIAGLQRMQRLLDIPTNQDDKTTILQAIANLIAEKLNANAIQQVAENTQRAASNTREANVELSLDSIDSGVSKTDKVVNEAAKILRLLHIKQLRELQTKINETIVSVQGITANPKTDSSLGKVGR